MPIPLLHLALHRCTLQPKKESIRPKWCIPQHVSELSPAIHLVHVFLLVRLCTPNSFPRPSLSPSNLKPREWFPPPYLRCWGPFLVYFNQKCQAAEPLWLPVKPFVSDRYSFFFNDGSSVNITLEGFVVSPPASKRLQGRRRKIVQ